MWRCRDEDGDNAYMIMAVIEILECNPYDMELHFAVGDPI